jgi:RNA polymerase sigma-B factor
MPAQDDLLEDLDAAAGTYAERLVSATGVERAALRDELTRYCLPFAGRIAVASRWRTSSRWPGSAW